MSTVLFGKKGGFFSKKCYHWEVDDDEEIGRKRQFINMIFLYKELHNLSCSFVVNNGDSQLVPSLVKSYC